MPSPPRHDLRAQGERDLAERLLREPEIRRAIEAFEREAEDLGARRLLLGTALRLSHEMAPDVHEIVESCRATLGIEPPVEAYVYPSPVYNAAAVRPERGLLFLVLSSSLLEAFEPDELRFVGGHELGHHLFEHHRIPSGVLLGGAVPLGPALALQLFAWQRYAEISSDRAGLICAGGLDPTARALFKLASGLRGGRVRIRIDQFLSQVGDLRQESERLARADEPMRSDWFATHPFSPLRLRAAELFAQSEFIISGGMPRLELESELQELMALMDPSYLQERSDVAEAMRRLLFAGAVLIATVSGAPDPNAVEELTRLLGPGSVPWELNPALIRQDLSGRIEAVKDLVPPLRRAQVIRDVCVIARADGRVTDAELKILLDIADAVGVDRRIVACAVSEPPSP